MNLHAVFGVLLFLSVNVIVECQDQAAFSENGPSPPPWNNEVTAADKRHDCGLRDVCPENATTIQSIVMSPEICRCDLPQCLRYGDCCWSLIENRTLPEGKNLWGCHALEAQNTSTTYALMISGCPETNRDEITRRLCEGRNVPPQNHTYLVDLPVYSNKTATEGSEIGGGGTLYKNIYCARCHNEKNSHIVPWTLQLACNVEFSPPERAEFMAAARYIPGERLWRTDDEDEETKCVLKIAELREFEIQNTIPNVRFCSEKAIATCPETTPSEPLAAAEARKLAKMCSRYAQYVMHGVKGTIYKNPHCALCQEAADEKIKDKEGMGVVAEDPASGMPTSSPPPLPLSCRRPTIATTFFKVRPGEAGAILPGAGLNFLFDFGLGGNKYVGYEMLCGEDEIWDYIRQKCGPMICKSGYVLQRGECVRAGSGKPPLIEIIGPRPNMTAGGSVGGGDGDEGAARNRTEDDEGRGGGHKEDEDPECTKYRILFHENEFRLLDDPPGAISVILPHDSDSNSNSNDGAYANANNTTRTQILLESEYEYVNETTISVCAKHLHRAFKLTFSPALNYVSLISVGLSVIFSAFHIALYVLLPKLRNPPGRNLLCLTASLFIFQLLFLVLFTHRKWAGLCTTSAVTMHYFSLAAFFWMNVMSFDMWRTFSCNSLLRRSHSTDSQKFIKYSIYAWTAPGLIVLTAVLLEFAVPERAGAGDHEDDLLSSIRPSYGENGLCWITQRVSLFVFFAVPVAFVVAVNIVLFSCTANAIFSQQKESSRVFKNKAPKKTPVSVSVDGSSVTTTTMGTNGVDRKSKASAPTHATNRDKVRLMLYVNMALIMGLGWILGFASQFLETDWLRYPFVIINGLQGTFIFFAFDFKRKIWRLLRDRLRAGAGGRLGRMFGLDGSTSSMGIGDTSASGARQGTRSSNLLSTTSASASEDDQRRKISTTLSLKQ